jgi:NAD(P)-dependent dehydrogenase (short-subunit alcohol dehydrogenase family)
MLDPKGRVALVTGASRGIGRAIAEELYRRGWTVSLGVRDTAAAKRATADWDPARVHVGRYDALDADGQARWVEEVLARFGRIDALVNNAGIVRTGSIKEIAEEALDEIWAVNCKAPLRMIKLCLPALEASGSGRVVNVASMSGKRVANDNVAYAMTKFAVVALSHAARRIAWDKGVRANALCPSFVKTDMTAGTVKIPQERMIDAADLAVLAATVIELPNTASVAELLVNCRMETTA